MNCDKSRKRNLLVQWGIAHVGQHPGTLDTVGKTITRMMRRTRWEVARWCAEQHAALRKEAGAR